MKLPPLASPEECAGLYIFDFGDRVSIGCPAEAGLQISDRLHRIKLEGGDFVRGGAAEMS